MELKSRDDQEQEQKQKPNPVSVLQGDGICMSRILARESSVGQSSRVFYRSNEGVPFRWEMQPGTPKNPHQDEDDIPPICPSPLMQSLGLPLPNRDRDDALAPPLMKTSKISRLKKMVKKRFNNGIIKKVHILSGRTKQQESSSRVSSICDVSMADGPFCCSPWNIPAILDEGSTRIYYCSEHKNAFAVEEDDLFLSRILSDVSNAEHFSGPMQSENISPAVVPFGWEMLPGTPKAAAENELIIPPPSPPPAVQSLSLPRPRPPAGGDNKDDNSTWKKAWFWMKRYGRKKEITKKLMQHEMSFRYNIGKMEEGFDAPSLRKTASVSSSSSSSSKCGGRVSRIRRNLEGSLLKCGPWRRRSEMLVFARRKWKTLAS